MVLDSTVSSRSTYCQAQKFPELSLCFAAAPVLDVGDGESAGAGQSQLLP